MCGLVFDVLTCNMYFFFNYTSIFSTEFYDKYSSHGSESPCVSSAFQLSSGGGRRGRTLHLLDGKNKTKG